MPGPLKAADELNIYAMVLDFLPALISFISTKERGWALLRNNNLLTVAGVQGDGGKLKLLTNVR